MKNWSVPDFFSPIRYVYSNSHVFLFFFFLSFLEIATSSDGDDIKKQFPYLLEHPGGKRIHYFINTNRCVFGGVRTVGSLLDNIKPVRGAEVLALSETVDSVWYYLTKYKVWLEYQTANNIKWIKDGQVIMGHL